MRQSGACPVPRNALIGAIADVAGVGERNKAVLRMLESSSALGNAKKAVDKAISNSRRSTERHTQLQYSSQPVASQSPTAARDTSTGGDEQALDVR